MPLQIIEREQLYVPLQIMYRYVPLQIIEREQLYEISEAEQDLAVMDSHSAAVETVEEKLMKQSISVENK